jgi:hypothetical protein
MDGKWLARSALLFLVLQSCGTPIESRKAVVNYTPPVDGGGGGGGDGGSGIVPGAPSEVIGFSLRENGNNNGDIFLHRADQPYADTTAPYVHPDRGTTGFVADLDRTKETNKCTILASETSAANRDILCIAEIEELDLYFNDLRIDVNIPASMCSYTTFTPYWYYSFQPGTGPTTVSYTVTSDGDVINRVNVSPDRTPLCTYNYTLNNGPNCCVGDYNLIVTTISTDLTSETTTTAATWPGRIGNCTSGAGSISTSRDSENRPIPAIRFIEGAGIAEVVTFPKADDRRDRFGDDIVSNHWAANFYNPSEVAAAPAGFHALDPSRPNRPAAMRIPDSIPNVAASLPQDTYEWQCLNRSLERLSRIRLMVREWDEGPITVGGVSDALTNTNTVCGVGAVTPSECSGDPDFPDDALNDFADWRFSSDALPGAGS